VNDDGRFSLDPDRPTIGCIVVWAAELMVAWEVGEPIATTVYVVLVVLFAVLLLTRIVPGAVHM
jgi:hypothetical protein